MKTVQIIRPILVNGVWLKEGQHDIDDATADAEEKVGNVDIVSVDGAPVVWGACCGDH